MAAVIALGFAAAAIDLRTRRIPNALTLGAAAAAVVCLGVVGGWRAMVWSAAGWTVGLLIFLPLFLSEGSRRGRRQAARRVRRLARTVRRLVGGGVRRNRRWRHCRAVAADARRADEDTGQYLGAPGFLATGRAACPSWTDARLATRHAAAICAAAGARCARDTVVAKVMVMVRGRRRLSVAVGIGSRARRVCAGTPAPPGRVRRHRRFRPAAVPAAGAEQRGARRGAHRGVARLHDSGRAGARPRLRPGGHQQSLRVARSPR